MKKILSIFMLISSVGLFSQDLPTIVPPSPNATAFHLYGKNSISHSTGSLNLSIPLYSIQQNGINFPISINYSGGNGIKVGEQASQVGLGWNLNSRGMISRVVKDKADDYSSSGYMHSGEIPEITVDNDFNYVNDNFKTVTTSWFDSEPDKYLINCLGLNFEFYIGKNDEVLTIPRNNVEINYNLDVNNFIDSFEVKDEYGLKYLFTDKESQKTSFPGFTENSYQTSTWMITEIVDLKTGNKILFNYDSYEYQASEQTITQYMFGNPQQTIDNQESYIYKEIRSKKVSSIEFNKGIVKFNYSDKDQRADVNGEYFVEDIEILDKNERIIKKIDFDYAYFSNRLQLKSIKEKDSSENSKPAYQFFYDESTSLPDKNSNGIDHWGFYNGEPDDQSLEPRRRVEHTGLYVTDTVRTVWGTGNREAWDDLNTSNIGGLNEVIYPTGGKSKFYYESHDCTCDDIPVKEITTTEIFYNLSDANASKRITVNNLDHLEFSNFSFSALNIIHNGTTYYPYYKVYLQNNGLVGEVNFYTATEEDKIINFYEPGSYKIELRYFDSSLNNELTYSNYQDPIVAKFFWIEEDGNPNRKIGGFRIQKIENYDNNDVLIKSTTYSYLTDYGISSGELLSIPIYQGYAYPYWGGGDLNRGLTRLVQPFIPLEHHGGSHVVYSKIRKTEIGTNNNGYIEYYYSHKRDSDFGDSYMALKEVDRRVYVKIPASEVTFPLPPKRNNSFARGLLNKEVHYNGSGSKVFQKENFYTKKTDLFGNPDITIPESTIPLIDIDSLKIKGLTFFAFDENPITPTYYYISTGYSFLDRTIETYYHTDSIIQTTNYMRDSGYFEVPTSTEFEDSKGNVLKTETTYVFNKTNKTSAEASLEAFNALYLPLMTKTYNSNTLLSTQYTKYNNTKWQDLNLPETIQTSKGTNSPEDRINYHDYDDKGNPTIVSKKDGTKIYYVWGYNQNQPIAKIENYVSTTSSQQTAINNAISASNIDNDTCLDSENCLETTLRTKLQDLRNAFPNGQVTTFTYDPLIGVTSITDPRGQTIYYEYDNFNRLEYVKDNEGNILSKNQYNYKN